MNRYDPTIVPDPKTWLALSEHRRIDLVVAYHKKQKHKLPSIKVHAVIHVVIENQIAENLAAVVDAMSRLSLQGLDRHASIHAIGSVLGEHIHEILQSGNTDSAEVSNTRYVAAVARLTVQQWHQQFEP